jgi:hypothetical protein
MIELPRSTAVLEKARLDKLVKFHTCHKEGSFDIMFIRIHHGPCPQPRSCADKTVLNPLKRKRVCFI